MIITVKAQPRDYDIILERGAIKNAGQLLDLERKVLVVTDTGVPAAYADAVAEMCAKPYLVRIEQGEASKSFERLQSLLAVMLEAGFTRRDCVVAVGGGVVGDLAGFTASCYMRGVDFYNIPTTLLSQVDSSIGGKTAVDFMNIKNVVGAFWQPRRVIVDPNVLITLPERQLHAGLAESIKMAATFDSGLFELIESCDDLDSCLTETIKRSLLIKRDVVEKDALEDGLRRALNFGHTVGHAIESYSDGALLHGECVALGMLPVSGRQARGRIAAVLEKFSLPTVIKQTPDELLPYITHDKKADGGAVNIVCCDEIGAFHIERESADDIRRRLENMS